MPEDNSLPVAVIGAGPVGLAAAAHCLNADSFR
jgi:cation diffusion facilitator CzcD-associated flavoprotein CzcO